MIISNTTISPLSPKRSGVTQTLANLVNQLGFLNAWGYESTTVAGTTTTANDMVGSLHMSNISAASQPTDSGGYLTFDGVDDALRVASLNYRNADTSGEVVFNYRLKAGSQIFGFLIQQESSLIEHYGSSLILSNTFRDNFNPANSSDRRSWRGSTNINNTTTFYTITTGSTGSSYYIIVSGNNETITMVTNADDGSWLNKLAQSDLLSIGGLYRTGAANIFANIDWKFSGYRPHTSIADSINANLLIHNKLNV